MPINILEFLRAFAPIWREIEAPRSGEPVPFELARGVARELVDEREGHRNLEAGEPSRTEATQLFDVGPAPRTADGSE